MKLVTQIKVEPEGPQGLLFLMMRFNRVCNYLSEIAFCEEVGQKYYLSDFLWTIAFRLAFQSSQIGASPSCYSTQAGALSATLGDSQHPSMGLTSTLQRTLYNMIYFISRAVGNQPDAPSQEDVRVPLKATV